MKKLLVVNVYCYIVFFLGLLIAGGLAFLSLDIADTMSRLALLIVAAIIFLLALLGTEAINLASYRIVQEQHKTRKEVSILQTASSKIMPLLVMEILGTVLMLIAMVPFVALLFLFSENAAIASMIDFAFAALLFVVLLLVFVFQFSVFELVLADKGAIDSMVSSFRLVKNNLIETITYDVIKTAIGGIIEFALTIPLYVVAFAYLMAVITSAGNLAVLVIASIVGLIGMIVWLLAYSVIHDTAVLPLGYGFWMRIRDNKNRFPQR